MTGAIEDGSGRLQGGVDIGGGRTVVVGEGQRGTAHDADPCGYAISCQSVSERGGGGEQLLPPEGGHGQTLANSLANSLAASQTPWLRRLGGVARR